jgi:hypothetical protein
MDPEIAESERLTVFVLDSGLMKEDGVHWRAFMPGKHDGERSLYRVDGLDFCDVSALGQSVASERQNQRLHGWGVFSANDVRTLPPPGLRLLSAEPPDRHGVIDCWPTEKHEQRNFAQLLAKCAGTIRFPFAP